MAVKVYNAYSLNGVSAPNNTSSVFLNSVKSQHTVFFKITDADDDITAMTVKLQGSPDNRGVTDANATWEDMGSKVATVTGADKAFAFSVIEQPIKRIRLQISAITGTADANDYINAWYIEGDN